jgi:Domain of unknown function (DUF4262)
MSTVTRYAQSPNATEVIRTRCHSRTPLDFRDEIIPNCSSSVFRSRPAGGVINELAERIRAGEDLLPGQLITFEEWPHKIIPEELPNPGEIAFSANRFYSRRAEFSVPVLQLSYDDKSGRFLWEPSYAAPKMQQGPTPFVLDDFAVRRVAATRIVGGLL